MDGRGIGILGGRASALHKPLPFKTRWAMLKNGDLWEVFTNIVRRRGPETIAISKVKGHATDEMVDEGQVRLSDKKGNDNADKAAERGATDSQYKVHRHGGLYSRRHKEYRTLMCRIQNYLVGLKEEERRLKQEAAKQKDPLGQKAERKTTVTQCLRYPGMGSFCGERDSDVGSEGVRLRMHKMHKVWCASKAEETHIAKVQSFLDHLTWQEAEDPRGHHMDRTVHPLQYPWRDQR